MLIRFTFENHRSVKEEQELSLVAAQLTEFPEKVIHADKYEIDLLRVVGIYGANASGKSTVLNALKFMREAVINSQRHWNPKGGVPREPFMLDPKKHDKPSSFEVDILLDDIRYTYGFIVDSVRVLEEWLYAYPSGNKQKWFVRDTTGGNRFTFSRFLKGENKAIRTLTRDNSLFLSAGAQNNHPQLTPIFEWFSSALKFVDDRNRNHLDSRAAEHCRNSKYQKGIFEIMKGADLGITGIDIEDEKMPDMAQRLLETLLEDNPDLLKQLKENPTLPQPVLRHRVNDKTDMPLKFSLESRGTQALFGLAGAVVETLGTGGLLCVDELDSSLHPLMAIEIVKLFNEPDNNPNNAQLIFNTHDTNILESGGLRRDQIWFTEKGIDGATSLYPLTDYKARKEENIKRGYLQGRYGGVPFIRTPENLITGGHDGQS